MAHQYRITVEKMVGNTAVQQMSFDTANHDDIFAILDKIDDRLGFSHEQTKGFIMGLKRFSEVMLAERQHPLRRIRPTIKRFINPV
ncbi:MAG: hypothetical protein PWP74_2102 [Shewanella sp.]|nr:hypothetical protein [Shewanella sp.]